MEKEKNVVELELFLIRHGESASNAGVAENEDEKLPGNPALTKDGLRMAELLGEYFSDYPLDYLLSSGLVRALNTGHELASHQPENGARKVEVHKIFTECGTGTDCIGQTISEMQKKFPLAVAAEGCTDDEKLVWHDREGATDDELLDRAKEAMAYIRGRFHGGEKVAVTAHAAFNTFLLYAALGIGWEQPFDPSYTNTGVTKLTFFKEGTGSFADVHLDFHNSTAHLHKEFPQFKFAAKN